MNGWLELRIFGNVATGLTSDRTVYFASLPGDTGDAAPGTIPAVTAADIFRTRAHLGARDANSLSRYDFNRDGGIDARDYTIVRANLFNRLGGLPGVPGNPPVSAANAAPPSRMAAPLTRRAAWDRPATGLLASVFGG